MKHVFWSIAVLVVLYIAPAAFAKPGFLNDFKETYPKVNNTRLDSCVICHKTASPYYNSARNPYGAAWDRLGRNFLTIESQDSDGDGFSNKDEIAVLSFPGNINDTPENQSDTPSDTNKCGGIGCASQDNVKSLLGDWLLVGLTMTMLASLSKVKQNL